MSFHIQHQLCRRKWEWRAQAMRLGLPQAQGWKNHEARGGIGLVFQGHRQTARMRSCVAVAVQKKQWGDLCSYLSLNQAHSRVTVKVMKPLNASHYEQSKHSGEAVERFHVFFSISNHSQRKKNKHLHFVGMGKKTYLSSHKPFINQFRSDKQLFLMVKVRAINLDHPISRRSLFLNVHLCLTSSAGTLWSFLITAYLNGETLEADLKPNMHLFQWHSAWWVKFVHMVGKLLKHPVALSHLTPPCTSIYRGTFNFTRWKRHRNAGCIKSFF